MTTGEQRKWQWRTRIQLLLAGWRPYRAVWGALKLPKGMDPFPIARDVLGEFGNLRFGNDDETIVLDPSVGDEIAHEVRSYEAQLGRRLYPLGYYEHQDRIYLLIDSDGVVYTMVDQLEPLASSFCRAIEYIVRMLRANRNVMEQDLERIGMLNKVWRQRVDRPPCP